MSNNPVGSGGVGPVNCGHTPEQHAQEVRDLMDKSLPGERERTEEALMQILLPQAEHKREAATSRPLDKMERIRARHLLQELSEHARSVRNAMDPLHGMHTVTVKAWNDQWDALKNELDYFTRRLSGE